MVDNDCKSKCVCQSSGLVKCEKLSCANGEVCNVRDGVRGCHPKRGHCTISHVGHLTSFDGMSGAIGVKGAFQVASLCDESAKLWFRVVVDVRACSKRASPAVATVYMFFRETTIAVNSQHVTWVRRCGITGSKCWCRVVIFTQGNFFLHLQVNGRKMSLPYHMANDLSIQASHRTVIIKASAVQVTYSLSQAVTIAVDSSLSGKVCGACGNYNDSSKDDMKTADGRNTTDVSVIVDSWSAGDFSKWWVMESHCVSSISNRHRYNAKFSASVR